MAVAAAGGPRTPCRPARGVGVWLAAAVGLGLAARLVFGLLYWTDKPLTLDEQEYLLLGRSLASGGGLTYPAVSGDEGAVVHFERPPVYPAVIAGALVATAHPWASPVRGAGAPVPLPQSSSDVPKVIPIVQAFVGAAGVWLIGLIAGRAAGPRAALIASFAAAVEPPLVWLCGFVMTEALYSTLALLTAWLLMLASGARRRAALTLALLAGLSAGVAVLTREAMILFLPLACLWLLARRRVVPSLALAAGVVIALAPWIARNHEVHGRFLLTAAHGGVNFWIGNNALAGGEGDLAANPDMKRARNAVERDHPGLSAQEMDAVYYREALAFIRERPLQFIALEAKKLFYTVVPVGPSYLLHSRLYRLGSWIPYALLVPLAGVGLGRLGRRAGMLWPILLLALSAVLMGLVFFPQERYRIPVIDPALIICAAGCGLPRRAGDVAAPGAP